MAKIVYVTPFAIDMLLFIFALIILVSAGYVLYARIRMGRDWSKWLIFFLTGVSIIIAAVLSGVFMKKDIYQISLLITAIMILINAVYGLIQDMVSFQGYIDSQ